MGFIAQQLRDVLDEMNDFHTVITDHDDGILRIAHNDLFAVILASNTLFLLEFNG